MLKRFACLLLIVPAVALAQPLDRVVAVVDDGVITASELEAQVVLLRQQITEKNMQVPSDVVLRKQVLQHLINVDLELQLAIQHSLEIDDDELIDAISKIAVTNIISLPELQKAVEAQGLTWKTYRENIRKELLISRLQQKAIGKEVMVTPQQVEDYLKTSVHPDKSQFTFHLQNIVIPLSEEPTSDQVKKARESASTLLAKIKKGGDFSNIAIEESSGEFALEGGDLGERHLAELPDVYAREVVKMKAGQVAGPLRTGNGFQLIKLVAMNGNNARHEVVKTRVRHILLKSDANMTQTEALEQISKLYQQLKSGKDFALMAKQFSLDAASAAKGGDLGWVTPGDLVPEFEKAMETLPLHQVSKPVKSGFGWHLIEVLERKKMDDTDAFQRSQVKLFLQQRKFTEAVESWHQHLRTNAYIKVMDKELA